MFGEKAKRNREIYRDRLNTNMTFEEIGRKYGIGKQRVKEICDREERRDTYWGAEYWTRELQDD